MAHSIGFKKNDYSFSTHYSTHEIMYEWTIENLQPYLYRVGELLESPTFPKSNIIDSSLWSIKAYFRRRQLNDNSDSSDLFINDITLSLVSHMRKEDLSRYQPKVIISFSTFNESSEEINDFPPTEIKFDGSTTEMFIHTIPDIFNGAYQHQSTAIESDVGKSIIMKKKFLFFKFDCSTTKHVKINGQQDRYKTLHKIFNWKLDSFHYFLSMNETRDCFYFETSKFDFRESTNLYNDDFYETRDPNKEHKWSIHLYPHGRNDEYKDFMSIFVKHISGPPVQAICEFRFEGQQNTKYVMSMPKTLFTQRRRAGIGECFKIDNFNNVLGSNVKITCRLKLIFCHTRLIETESSIDYSNKNALRFLNRLFIDYKNQMYCDISLYSEIDKTYLQLHKIVLYATSEKFEKLINEELNKSQNIVDANNNGILKRDNDETNISFNLKLDDEPSNDNLPIIRVNASKICLQKFIKFLYKHELEKENKLNDLIELLQFSINYEISTLRIECQNLIIRNYINNDSLMMLLKLGEHYLIDELKKSVYRYIKRYYNQLIENDNFKFLIKNINSHEFFKL